MRKVFAVMASDGYRREFVLALCDTEPFASRLAVRNDLYGGTCRVIEMQVYSSTEELPSHIRVRSIDDPSEKRLEEHIHRLQQGKPLRISHDFS